LKRARKAQRRKQAVAAKRQEEAIEATLAGCVRRALATPIQHCLLSQSLLDDGIGTLLLARGPTPGQLALRSFLLDTFCLVIKDVLFRRLGGDEFAEYCRVMGRASPLAPVDPSYARKLLRDLAAWAHSIGFAPSRDFEVVERVFGDVDASACDVAFAFGQDGKAFYVPGPTESPSLVRRRLEHLRRKLGDDGFGYSGAPD
jgi:hypothetical protein